jgi:hypothetical protein
MQGLAGQYFGTSHAAGAFVHNDHAADGLYMSCLSRPEWAMNMKSCRWRSDGMVGLEGKYRRSDA